MVTFHDITDSKQAEHQLAAQYRTARVLAEAESIQEALPRVLKLCCEELGWQMGLAWVPDEDGEMHCQSAYARAGWEEQLALLSHETRDPGAGRGRPGLATGPACVRARVGQPGPAAAARGRAAARRAGGPGRAGRRVAGVVQLIGSDLPRSDGQPEAIETITAQLFQYAERKRSDEAAARMKDQFVSTVSHELRTPLAAMDGWLHILLDGEPGPLNEEQHRFLTTVKRNSDRLMRLVGDLLLIGQMDAGTVHPGDGRRRYRRAGR